MKDMNETELADSQESIHFKNTGASDLFDRAATIQKLLSENGAEISVEEIEAKLKEMTEIFKVPAAEAQRSVTNAFLKKYGISKTKVFAGKGSAVTKKIAEINAMAGMPDAWVNFTGKVIQIWDSTHESIAQAGLVGDETGIIKFTIWSSTEINPLELNKTYDFKNVVVKSWNDKASITLNKAATIAPAAEEIVTVKAGETILSDSKDRTNELRTVAELQQGGIWTDLKANIVQLFEKTHESIAFAGVLGDETGTMRFTVWKTSEIENIEAGKSYLLKNAITKEWNGNIAVEINRAGKVEEIDEEIVAKASVFELCGCAVDIQAGSGLIRRCPECNKVMTKGMCTEHGKVKGKYDLRIKAVFDDGSEAHETIINCELTQKLLNIELADAVMMATETLDPECINDIIKKEFIGKYYVVRGAKTDRYIIVENVERAEPIDANRISQLKDCLMEELDRKNDAEKIENGEIRNDEIRVGENRDIEKDIEEMEELKSSDFEEFEKILNSIEAEDEGIEEDEEIEIEEIKVI
ncbi:replication protein A [Methanimicrococcus blatticola]|uniref:Replication factor A1 n=1 Tax=Methanimicrococcus blatticola TaxID=91560 RepID=A0A484F3G1_9EURY|nr:replication protein A [Methanimicrococcus blatticola]MBZ3935411.1 replication protein A [Methanimicrococcus blatticola]MCC2508491.1 replication protein A [Methanimicrococcus blatticola]TDQ67799.1 replication factor A1 [Methanimicrococcus blatticola]